ncbi:hypothetical protein OH738_36430 [Streptomyces hirsutus]|uniref:Uncharacterized protein n=1 Tax=Streptomyces hirsutus TaxID=35620 RepID=A0ABZ1GFI7_9ACTN|nr:hypothetical protein [Streptomyces hirsutus]WSD04906.1 hypothetical protein OIE73_03475 [Streptomyces hirsutus]WTD21701.1 hypothetical protein OH738_36430 [Streptomyces hirsutus]
MTADVTVHIELLVLDGVAPAPGAAERLRAALARGLAAALAERPPDGPGAAVPELPALRVPGPPLAAGTVLSAGQAADLGHRAGLALAAGLGGAPGGTA